MTVDSAHLDSRLDDLDRAPESRADEPDRLDAAGLRSKTGAHSIASETTSCSVSSPLLHPAQAQPISTPPMAASFLEDPRFRQRWNQLSYNAEAVTENAAAGIWTFQHRYINPCLACLGDAVFEPCIAPCFGDRDERARRARARDREREYARAEYTFDFYDDWDDDDELLANGRYSQGGGGIGGGSGGILGGWGARGHSRGEDWDRLIGGSGITGGRNKTSTHGGEVAEQPKRKRGMSYGTRGGRRKSGVEEEDPTIIPSTAPLGFLGRLPWKIGGQLRYKPSAAFLQDHPGSHHPGEHQPLLDEDDGDEDHLHHSRYMSHTRKRSGTSGSGDTSDSYRSRGDLFPSDGEGDEDAMEIDDEFAVVLDRVETDRASSNTRSSKGKRPADSRRVSRTVSATTLSSSASRSSFIASMTAGRRSSGEPTTFTAHNNMEDSMHSFMAPSSIEDLHREEEEAERMEDQEVARKREAAAQLARQRGLSQSEGKTEHYTTGDSESRAQKSAIFRVDEVPEPRSPQDTAADEAVPSALRTGRVSEENDFIPARLPNFR